MLHSILYQFRGIGLLWWMAISVAALLLFLFRNKRKQLTGNMLMIYILIIIVATVLSRTQVEVHSHSELLNLDLIGTWFSRVTGDSIGRSELLLNFCMLLPIGILFPWATEKGFLVTVVFGLSLTTLIEFAQLIMVRGWFELTDIVDNTIGVVIGYGLYRFGAWLWRKVKC